MSVTEWNYTISLEVERVAENRRRLTELLDKAYDEFSSGTSVEKLDSSLNELTEYAACHFAIEQALMEKGSYPGLAQHREEHERFLLRIIDMHYEFPCMHRDVSLEVLSFLKEWLSNHFTRTDAAYCLFFAAKKASE
jgi:hemerythrin